MKKIIVIGGSDLGISTSLRIRELDKSIRPLVITDNKFPNYSICGIPFYIGGEVNHWQDLAHRTYDDIKKAGIDLMLNSKVININPEEKIITVLTDDQKKEIKYDKVILGTGGKTIQPSIEGIDLPGVFFMRWMDDCLNYDNYIKNNQPNEAVIVGGGYVGLEMAEALVRRGLKVTIVEFMDYILNTVDKTFRKIVQKKLEDEKIKINTGTAIEKIEKNGEKLLVSGNNGFQKEVDTVLVSVGTKPNTELGEKIGIKAGIKGAYKVNEKMETNIPDIYAGGDCAETLNSISGKYSYYALGSVAHKHGRIIGSNICGQDRKFSGVIGTQAIKIFDMVVARTGFNEKEAIDNGFQAVAAEIETWDHKKYFSPVYKTKIHVIADKNSKRILGAQILGNIEAEISKRIDIFASAIFNNMTVSDFNQIDLSYTPPLSSPWDPVQLAVQKLEKLLK